MPRGPGKKENYNLDYSRFNQFDQDEEKDQRSAADDKVEADAAAGMPDIRDMMRSVPPELREAYHLMSIARENGDTEAQKRANELALKAVEKGGPEVRNSFMKNIGEMMPELQGKLSKDMDPKTLLEGIPKDDKGKATVASTIAESEDTELRISTLREEMLKGQKETRKQMEELEKKQQELEKIRNPEEFFKFMTEEGITQEDLQRIFSGDESHMKARFEETMASKEADKQPMASEQALKKVNHLHSTLFGTEPEEEEPKAPEPEPKPVKKKPKAPEPKEPEVTIPMYRLQYQKDDTGKYTVVELKCNLPGVADMSAINLDVSEKHLRLSTIAPAPLYAVNAGPFPVLIDPSGARAKYSKKREELSISVPAKMD